MGLTAFPRHYLLQKIIDNEATLLNSLLVLDYDCQFNFPYPCMVLGVTIQLLEPFFHAYLKY